MGSYKLITEEVMTFQDIDSTLLDKWAEGWVRGDSAILYKLLDDTFTLDGLSGEDVVTKRGFKMFWVGFRLMVEESGGPKSVSGNFTKLKNKIRTKMASSIVESGHWEIAGFAAGLYMVIETNGKIVSEKFSITNRNSLGLSWEEYSDKDGISLFENKETLNRWRYHWSRGETEEIYNLQDPTFTFTFMAGTHMEKVVNHDEFKEFFEEFKNNAEKAGGPPNGSKNFMSFRNIILTQVGDVTIEIAGWQVSGFADSTYIVGARNNKLIWARVIF